MSDLPGTTPPRNGLSAITDFQALADHLGPIVDANKAEQTKDSDASEMSGEGWHGIMTCRACPVQIEGEVDGFAFYFRARWESWRIGISRDPLTDKHRGKPLNFDDRADPRIQAIGDATQFDAEGEGEGQQSMSGSWMPYAEAWRHVADSLAAFRARAVSSC